MRSVFFPGPICRKLMRCRFPIPGVDNWLLLLGALLPVSSLPAQNLVSNPSFEFFDHCPPYPGQIHECTGWDAPNNNTTDYFHACSPVADGASVPDNLLGNQSAATGEAYAGIRVWIPVSSGNPTYREYLGSRLQEPLEVGRRYVASFKISLAETSSHATDQLGIYFSKTPPANERVYMVNPQISTQAGQLLDNTSEWVLVFGSFIAEGGEQYIVIGNFQSDEAMQRQLISDNDEPKVYYYIDDVSVKACALPSPSTIVVDTVMCIGKSLLLRGHENAVGYQWQDGATTEMRIIDQPGEYQVVSTTACYDQTTIYRVEAKNCSCEVQLPSPRSLQEFTMVDRFPGSNTNVISLRQLILYDVLGRCLGIRKAIDLDDFRAEYLASGMYFYVLEYECRSPTGEKVMKKSTGKWILLR